MTKVIVYTPGNCGSKSVSQALKNANVEHYYGHRIQHLLDTRPQVYDEIMDPDSIWKVITLVRDPIDWSLSLLARRMDQGNATKVELRFEDYCHILGWFDSEFKSLFDIDVYLERFKLNIPEPYPIEFDKIIALPINTAIKGIS